jgi:DUF2934 family protein
MSPKQKSNGGEQTKSGPEAAAGDGRAPAIARLAYEKWQARGCPDGDDRRDWFEAEQEVLAAAESRRQPTATSSPARNRA